MHQSKEPKNPFCRYQFIKGSWKKKPCQNLYVQHPRRYQSIHFWIYASCDVTQFLEEQPCWRRSNRDEQWRPTTITTIKAFQRTIHPARTSQGDGWKGQQNRFPSPRRNRYLKLVQTVCGRRGETWVGFGVIISGRQSISQCPGSRTRSSLKSRGINCFEIRHQQQLSCELGLATKFDRFRLQQFDKSRALY